MSAQTVLRWEEPEVLASRRRAAARNRALSRLAQEYPERYRELYAEERGAER